MGTQSLRLSCLLHVHLSGSVSVACAACSGTLRVLINQNLALLYRQIRTFVTLYNSSEEGSPKKAAIQRYSQIFVQKPSAECQLLWKVFALFWAYI